MRTLENVYRDLIRLLKCSGVDTPDLEARIILHERARYDWSDIIASPEAFISDEPYAKMMSDAKQRAGGKPLSRIYGRREFWGLPFALSQETLDPRPDTEVLIETALEIFPVDSALRILDLGTGSGCILIALLSEFKNATGIGLDISRGAVETARSNAVKNDCAERAHFMCGSWCDAIQVHDPDTQFDLIVSNPPYITNRTVQTLSAEVRHHDPILGLAGGEDGLDAYRNIFLHIEGLLKPTGTALFEIGYDQKKDVMRLSKSAGLLLRSVRDDLSGNPRVVEISCGDK